MYDWLWISLFITFCHCKGSLRQDSHNAQLSVHDVDNLPEGTTKMEHFVRKMYMQMFSTRQLSLISTKSPCIKNETTRDSKSSKRVC